MLLTLRAKSQITIPSSIISSLGLKEGDQLDIYESDGIIHIVPVTVYPKSYVSDLQSELSKLKSASDGGEVPDFTTIDAILTKLK